MRRIAIFTTLAIAGLWLTPGYSRDLSSVIVRVSGPQSEAKSGSEAAKKEEAKDPSPEQKMARRFPQPVRVGFLIGLPVLDWDDSTIGYIQRVVRTLDGKIKLVVPYSSSLGWLSPAIFSPIKKRPVAVPLESVAILARQVAALDMSREDFDAAPNFRNDAATPIPHDEIIRIAITRR